MKAIDMETAAFAVRSISNTLLVDGTDPDVKTANIVEAPKNAVQVMLEILKAL